MGCVPDRVTMGIDEAGRGPVLGPMVMAAVCLKTRSAAALTRAGLRDSKSYGASTDARERRADLAARIRRCAVHIEVRVVDVADIDRRVALGELNVLEREVAEAFILAAPTVDRIVADGRTLFAPLSGRYPKLEAHNNGESVHAAVAAASVIAKNRRDEIFARIAQRYSVDFGPVAGGGYVNKKTKEFLRAYAEKHRCLPPEARRSWPHTYLEDILGSGYDPYLELGVPRPGQLALC